MNIFIDTNIWLSFYHFSSDDLEELRKLGLLLEKHTVRVHLPEQVIEEFRRNREAKFVDAMKRFKDEKLSDEFPQLCRQYDREYRQMREAIAAYREAKKLLLQQVEDHYEKEELKADQVIQELFGKATKVKVSHDIIDRAKLRMDKGNPPGKKGSFGDAINWECLLATLNPNCDLYFIAEDKDWRSAWDEEDFEAFLKWEWKSKNGGAIKYFRRLSMFLKAMFPDINLKDEVEKEAAIKKLCECHNFAASHIALEELAKFTSFSSDQVNTILKEVTTNNQIYGISQDWDINDNVRKIIDNHSFDLDPAHYELYRKYFVQVEVERPKVK
jgi:predicted nucleic acid-binding protein